MRLLLTVTIPMKEGNAAMRDGSIGKKLEDILTDLKPEAVYFSPSQGKRAVYLVVDVPDGSKIPSVAEPFFLAFNASVDAVPVFTRDDLAKAAKDLEQAVQKYG